MENLNSVNNLTKEDKKCKAYSCFYDLAKALSDYYEIIPSCNKNASIYLVPKGTADQLSYYGKPVNSFRVSIYWNWYSSLTRCNNPKYIQCYCPDLPFAKKRPEPEKASKPILASLVAFYGPDTTYHHVFGDRFDRKTKTWIFEEPSVDDILWHTLGFVKQ